MNNDVLNWLKSRLFFTPQSEERENLLIRTEFEPRTTVDIVKEIDIGWATYNATVQLRISDRFLFGVGYTEEEALIIQCLVSQTLLDNEVTWIIENVKGKCYCTYFSGKNDQQVRYQFSFEDPSEAMLFKLTWR